MKNKFTITEEEKCRILNLHESVFLKENNLLNENTVALSASENSFSPYGSWSRDPLLLYKGTTFKVSPTIPNSLVTTTKVEANLVQYGTFGLSVYAKPNKAFVVCDCNNKTLYLSGMTDKRNDGKDIKNNSKARWVLGNNMLSMINLCKTATAIKPVDVVTPTPPKEETKFKEIKIVGKRKKDKKTYIAGTKGDKYTFDFDAVMKAIDDTGKCSNVISDVNKVFKQTKQENFLILSDNGTPEKSDLITPEGSKWKTNANLSTGDAKAYIIIGSDDDSLIQSDGLIFTCKPALIKNVTYSFYYGKTKKVYSNEELGSILKNQFCDGKINQDPIKDDVKSGLNNVVTPVNTTISKDKYYEYISN